VYEGEFARLSPLCARQAAWPVLHGRIGPGGL